MAADPAYRFKSATWGGVAVVGALDCNEEDTVEEVTKHRTANATANQATFVDGVGARVTLSVSDTSQRALTAMAIGDVAALVIIREKRAEGKGAVAASDKTATYSNATIVSKREGVPIRGRATLDIGFECADPSGVSPVAFS